MHAMKTINLKKEVTGNLEGVIQRLSEALKGQGFGILTRIDFHSKMKEKLGKDLPPVVILGACNPSLAYEAYLRTPDVTALLPCNAVVREVDTDRYSVELAKPSAMMEVLGDQDLAQMACEADARLEKALESV
jgi:uncharacterized protein (DUF302 family)